VVLLFVLLLLLVVSVVPRASVVLLLLIGYRHKAMLASLLRKTTFNTGKGLIRRPTPLKKSPGRLHTDDIRKITTNLRLEPLVRIGIAIRVSNHSISVPHRIVVLHRIVTRLLLTILSHTMRSGSKTLATTTVKAVMRVSDLSHLVEVESTEEKGLLA
jgi:hypothetical protein